MPSPTGSSNADFSTPSGVAEVDALLWGTQWTGATLAVSFPDVEAYWSTDPEAGYGPVDGPGEPWSPSYQPLFFADYGFAADALAKWSAVAELEFVFVEDNDETVGDIRFAYTITADTAGAQAWVADFPDTTPRAGDVWFSADQSNLPEVWYEGSYEYMTVLHELGHALGLKHPFQPSPFNEVVLAEELDSRAYTVMSYSAFGGAAGTTFMALVGEDLIASEPTTPMVLDILAIQHLYGQNLDYNATDTTYLFFEGNSYHQTIWDGDGNDTLQYVSVTPGVIDLREGLEGGSQLGNPLVAFDPATGLASDTLYNVWIAYGAVIENAVAGAGDDIVIGNDAANRLVGGSGRDAITGLGGDDLLDGGRGADTLEGGPGNDRFVVGAGDRVIEAPDEGADTVESALAWTLGANLENLVLTGTGATSGTGNSAANALAGNAAANSLNGQGGADTLAGGGGNDTLSGSAGNDRLAGGPGSDAFVFNTALSATGNVDTLTDFLGGSDRIRLDDDIFTAFDAGSGTALKAGQFYGAAGANQAHDADDRIVYNTSTGALYYDRDGLAGAAAVKFAMLTVGTSLSAADFQITA